MVKFLSWSLFAQVGGAHAWLPMWLPQWLPGCAQVASLGRRDVYTAPRGTRQGLASFARPEQLRRVVGGGPVDRGGRER